MDEHDQRRLKAGKEDSDREEAFEAMVCEHQAWVRGYLRSQLADWAAADDLAQDVFVTAYAKMRDFRGDSGVASWLRGIARNHLRNYIRKHREAAIGGGEELQALIESGGDAWNGEQEIPARLDALAECLRRLPAHAKALLEQRYVAGRSMREMAEASGKEYSALAMQLRRMREMLADCITKKMERGNRT